MRIVRGHARSALDGGWCSNQTRKGGVGVPSKEVERIGDSVHRTSERGGFFKRRYREFESPFSMKVPRPGRSSSAEVGKLQRGGASVRGATSPTKIKQDDLLEMGKRDLLDGNR